MATFGCTVFFVSSFPSISLSVLHSLLLNNSHSGSVWVLYVWLRVPGCTGGADGHRTGGSEALWPLPFPPVPGVSESVHLDGNIAYLCGILLFPTIWITMTAALPLSLFLSFTLSRKHWLAFHSLVSLSASPLPSLPSAASPFLITPINIFNSCHVSPAVCPLSVLFSSFTLNKWFIVLKTAKWAGPGSNSDSMQTNYEAVTNAM